MLSNIKISTRLFVLNILMFLVAALAVVIVIVTFNNIQSDNSEILYREMLGLEKQKIEISSNTIAQMLEDLCKDEISKDKQLEIIKNGIQSIRYGSDKSGYFFVYEGTVARAVPIKVEVEGTDLGDVSDSTGVFFVKELMQKAQKGGGFVEYWFDKPGKGIHPKLSYATKINGTPFWMGTGIYIDNVIDVQDEVNSQMAEMKNRSIFLIVIGVCFFLFLIVLPAGWEIQKSISRPIITISNILQQIGKGIKVDLLKENRKDEIGMIINSLNEVIEGQNNASDFASAIGREDFDFKYNPQSREDILGNSLLAMRDNIQTHRKVEAERHWKNEGLTMFNDITHSHVDDIQELSRKMIKELVNYIGANQGCLYQVKKEKEIKILERMATYAWSRIKYVKEQIQPGIGLVGQVWLEKEPTYLEEIPQDYLLIKSGLGEANPTMIFILPLISNEEVQGVLEIASFKKLTEIERDFLESLAESLGSWLWSLHNAEKTKFLLEESQHLSATLQAGEEELRQNMEELQATHEEMRRREESSRKQIELLNASKELS